MNGAKKRVMAVLCILALSQGAHAYRRERVILGEKPSFTPEYVATTYENGERVLYAVDLTPREKNLLQQAVKKHFDTDRDFNRTINEENSRLILSGCKNDGENICNTLEQVLRDFQGKSLADLFSRVGLSRDI